jgi:hypothetical protein
MHSQNEATFDLPLMLTAVEAKGIALRQLHSAWLERTGYEWRLSWTHVDLEPADVVQVALDDGTLLNVRMLETELGGNLELAWKSVLEESSSYTVTAVPSGGLNYLPQVDPVSSEARLFLLDVPLIPLVEETLEPGMSVSFVARKHGLSPSLLFKWRQRMAEGGREAVRADAVGEP